MGIGFAGAGGEEDGLGVNGDPMIVEIVPGNFAACGKRALGLRIIAQRSVIAERGKNRLVVVVEAALRGIGRGEINEWNPGGAKFVKRASETIRREVPVGAVGKHAKENDSTGREAFVDGDDAGRREKTCGPEHTRPK